MRSVLISFWWSTVPLPLLGAAVLSGGCGNSVVNSFLTPNSSSRSVGWRLALPSSISALVATLRIQSDFSSHFPMEEKPKCTVYIGNLDERVTDRILYDILIQAGRVIDLHIPRDRETNKSKGFAFAEYETEEIADYAVKLFSGLVTLYNRTLKFAISGQDKASSNKLAPNLQYSSLSLNSGASYSSHNSTDAYHSARFSTPSQFPSHRLNSDSEEGEPAPPGVRQESNQYRSHYDGNNSDFARRAFGQHY